MTTTVTPPQANPQVGEFEESSPFGGGTEPEPPLRRRHRKLRALMLVIVVLLIPTGWSYAGYLTAPGDAPVSTRSVDWAREHGFAPVINLGEQWWYTRHKPTGAKPPARDLPVSSSALTQGRAAAPLAALPAPDVIKPLVTPSLPGEGVWKADGGFTAPAGTVQSTYLRPDPKYPSASMALVRLDQAHTRLVYVPGARPEFGTGWAWGAAIPRSQRSHLIAAFNAGFKFKDTLGGAYTEGRTIRPLVKGEATAVISKDGTVDIVDWGRDVSSTAGLASVRQNLALIVDGGKPVPDLRTDQHQKWGTPKSQLQFTWRSGLGIDAQGRLIYAAGRQMTLTQLATTLARAGAVRGMQLDIHSGQVDFNLFRPDAAAPRGVTASKLMKSMPRTATRFLSPDDRDFFTVEAR